MENMTIEELDSLQDRIAMKALMIQMGEKIKWGSDSEALREANAAITSLRAQLAAWKDVLSWTDDDEKTLIDWYTGGGDPEGEFARIGLRRETPDGQVLYRTYSARGPWGYPASMLTTSAKGLEEQEKILPKSTAAATITYKNWRGEVASRTIVPDSVWYGVTQWHPKPQWFLRAIDIERQALRDFAIEDIVSPSTDCDALREQIISEVWAEIEDSRKDKWPFRRDHVQNAVSRAFALHHAALQEDTPND
jgi:hypothetical protein